MDFIVLFSFFSFSQEVYKRKKQKRKQLNVLTLTDWLNRVKKGYIKCMVEGTSPKI